ncbi:MAG TPA: HEAT repeat domain-containing protein [Burkholderiaceae bacterium]
MPNTPSDALLRLALWVGIGSVILTLVMVASIAILRMRLRRSGQREVRFLEHWRPALAHVLAGSPVQGLPPLPQADRIAFLKYWNYLQESLRGTANETLNAVARAVGADTFAQQGLASGSRAERLLAILTLGHLRETQAWDALASQAAHPDSLMSLHAARALLQVDAGRGARLLMPLIIRRHDWDINRLTNMLAIARPDFEIQLRRYLGRVDARHAPRLLRLAEALQLRLPAPLLASLLGGQRPGDVVAASLRLVHDASLLPQVRSLLRHADWRVRVQLARCLGRIGEPPDIVPLTLLTQDREWWVRYRAVQALSALPFVSTQELQRLRDSTTDRYAQDMLNQVFAERGIA